MDLSWQRKELDGSAIVLCGSLRRNRSGEEMRAKIQVQFQGEEGKGASQEALISSEPS